MAPPGPPIHEQITLRLAPYLGAVNARVWVKMAARQELDLDPADLSTAHVDGVLEGLRPSLRTFMGRAAAAELLEKIRREVP